MKCLRCGYCCKNCFVEVVDNPEWANEQGIDDGNLFTQWGDGTPCKHLKGDKPGEYECALHEYDFYKETPCHEFTQVEIEDSNCRLGEYVLKNSHKI